MNEAVIDYAKPLINVEYITRIIHDACLNKDYKHAREIAIELSAEVRLLINTLTLMEGEQRARNRG